MPGGGVYNIWKARSGESTDEQWGGASTQFRAMLIQSSNYTFDVDANFVTSGVGDLVTNECTGLGYTTGDGFQGAGRILLETRTVTADDTNDRGVYDSTDIIWASIDVSVSSGDKVGMAIICELGTSDVTSIPVCYFDSTDLDGSGVTTNGGNLTIAPSTSGWFTLT